MMTHKDENKPADIAIAFGDGVGPEIMNASLHILKEAGAELTFHDIEVGEKVYLRGHRTGIEPKSWDVLQNCQAFLKAPITTPQGGGFRSLNVTIRITLGLYANVRPCVAYAPCVDTRYPGMNLVIVRENEEDLYTGLEYRPSHESYHAIKMTTKSGCQKIIHYAFEYAQKNGRKKVTCFTKDNILKMTDGLFHKTFEEIAKDYPDIIHEHWIVDIGAAKMADTPENFDVIVTANLYGDILSDIAAQIAGSVGLAGSANIGDQMAMFEAIHGSAPRRAGQNLANPSGLLMAAVMMLVHIGKFKSAELIHNAWLTTLEEGIHTYDIFDEKRSRSKVGTKEFAKAVVANLGKKPEILTAVHYLQTKHGAKLAKKAGDHSIKTVHGVDIFIEDRRPIQQIAEEVEKIAMAPLSLQLITSRGAVIWPTKHTETAVGDLLRLRFTTKNQTVTPSHIIKLQELLEKCQFDVTGHETLSYFGDVPGFSLSPEEQ